MRNVAFSWLNESTSFCNFDISAAKSIIFALKMKKDTMYIQVLIFSIADGVYCLEVAPLYMTPEEGS